MKMKKATIFLFILIGLIGSTFASSRLKFSTGEGIESGFFIQ